MSVNSVVENKRDNPYLASYNSCIKLGVPAVVGLFTLNVELNPYSRIIASIIQGRVGPDAIEDLELIVEKLKKDELLTRGEQIILGMIYLEAGAVVGGRKKNLLGEVKEADFFARRSRRRRGEISYLEKGGKSEKMEEEIDSEKKESSSNKSLGLAEAKGSVGGFGKMEAPRLVNKALALSSRGNLKPRNGQNMSLPHGRSPLRETTGAAELKDC